MTRRWPGLVRNPGDGFERALHVRNVLRLVLGLNLVAVGAKLLVWWWTGALSIMAEAAHSGLDALNNVIALAFARVALREPDSKHPYGHQKFETLGALVVVGFLSITVFELMEGAIRRLVSSGYAPVETPLAAFVVLGGTAAFGTLVAGYERREGKRTGSELLLADAAHTNADALGTMAVILGLVAVRMGFPMADPLVAILLSAFIGYSGWRILRSSIPLLVDERAVEEQKIRAIAEETEGVHDCYAVRSRGRPGHVFVELTIAVDAALDVEQSHAIADEVERRLGTLFGAREVVVHVEPAG